MISYIESHLASFETLPTELLQEIFFYAVPLKSPLKSLCTLSQVSTRWRDATLSTPLLWTIIDLPHSESEDMFNIFVNRSGNLPLHISIALSPLRTREMLFPPSFDINRLKSLELPSYFIGRTNQWEAPAQLDTLIVYGYESQPDTRLCCPRWSDRVKRLELRHVWLDRKTFRMKLCGLILRGVTVKTLTLNLSITHCKSLESIELYDVRDESVANASIAWDFPIEIRGYSLKHLTLDGCSDLIVWYFLREWEAPLLSSATIVLRFDAFSERYTFAERLRWMVVFVSNSLCSLCYDDNAQFRINN